MTTFITPFTCIIQGATGTGKTHFVKRVLDNQKVMFQTPPAKVVYFYAVDQPLFKSMKNVIFHKGIPDKFESFADYPNHTLFVLDDVMIKALNDPKVAELFTVGSHHMNISVFFLSHNLFHQGKMARTIGLSCHYLILFRSLRDALMITYLGRQLFPGQNKILIECYEDATSEKYSYLFIDLSPHSYDGWEGRIKSRIFPGEGCWVYKPIEK